jgi:hypothetical protein
MLKRVMLIGVLAFGMMVLLQAQAMATYTLPSNQAVQGCAWKLKPNGIWDYCCYTTCRGNCYWFQWVVVGGSNPHDYIGYLLATEGKALAYSLVCTNPGGDFDVRAGKGGITFFIDTSLGETSVTQSTNGKTLVQSGLLCENVNEDVFDVNGDPVSCGAGTPSLFEKTWGVSTKDCRNSNWSPYAIALSKLELTGDLYNGCPLGATSPDDCTGTKTSNAKVYCETNTPVRTIWTYGDDACNPSTDPYCRCEQVTDPDGIERNICTNTNYLCVNSGSPIAWDDSYSVRAGRTLTVKAPGVLTNDHDTGDSPTSISATYVTDSTGVIIGDVAHGTLTLYSDGSFMYTPVSDYIGGDSFIYRAFDGSNYSNVATVTITVK